MKKMLSIITGIGLVLSVAVGLIIWKSPYKKQKAFPYRLISYTVTIHASADSVFRFLGNSKNATRWSVFVHHITPLKSNDIRNGMPGSQRRCFCDVNETGKRWDETV